MSDFDETKHPRGHASNPGAFSGKDNSGPDTVLSDHKDPAGRNGTMTARIGIIARNGSGETEYKGRTVESIIRRLYGAKATFRVSQDRNSPEAGLIVTPAYKNSGVYSVEAQVLWTEGDHEADRAEA